MKSKIHLALAMLLLGAAAFYIQGCSVFGYTVGAMSDASKPDSLYLSAWQTLSVKPGKHVNVILHDGKKLSGKYLGIYRLREQEYTESYADLQRRHHETAMLPALNSIVEIQLESGKQWKHEFLGFDCQFPGITTGAKSDYNIATLQPVLSLRSIEDTTSSVVFFKHVASIIDDQGNVTEREILDKLASANDIPFRSAILLQDSSGRSRIAVDRVIQIEFKNSKSSKWDGLVLGALVDATLIFIAVLYAALSETGL